MVVNKSRRHHSHYVWTKMRVDEPPNVLHYPTLLIAAHHILSGLELWEPLPTSAHEL
jgi:hypothetical protein